MMAPLKLAEKKKVPILRQHVLIVDDESDITDLVKDLLAHRASCRVMTASSLEEARAIIGREPVDLLIADLKLPDGEGLSLLPLLRDKHPLASSIVISGHSTTDLLVRSIRNGAVDFVPKPFSADQLSDRIENALTRQASGRKRDRQFNSLRRAVLRLNQSRKTVAKKVDLLCNDLISAYSELSRQFDSARLQEGFQRVINQTTDLEQLLCHSMDWLLRQLGYANVGVWLAANEKDFHLGAYMKYTVAGEPKLTHAMQRNLVRQVMRAGVYHASGAELREKLIPGELEFLSEQDVLGVNCTYLGESLGVILLFRDAQTPFKDQDVEALKMVSPLFAMALTKAVTAAESAEGGSVADGPADVGEDDHPPQRRPGRKKKDPSDWWKRGEEPPF